MIIAIDGPAGSGKSTTARAVAERLGFRYLDTGAMYRAVTLAFVRAGVDAESQEARRLLGSIRIDLEDEEGGLRVRLDGEDVTDAIRRPEVSAAVSSVAAVPAVRESLVRQQRRLAEDYARRGSGVVLDGRDIGTHVFPDAPVKVFLVANEAVRAARRMRELQGGGVEIGYEQVLEDLRRRDELDSARAHAPLRKADDAVELDTTDLSIAQQVEFVERLVRERRSSESVL
ncbi:MAG TPA: (d)CMP kinase [Rhodothermales bacterium]